MQKLKVKQAFVQTSIQIPHVFAPQTNLYEGTVPGIKMEFWPTVGLLITVPFQGKEHIALVPEANVKLALLVPEELSVSADKAKSK